MEGQKWGAARWPHQGRLGVSTWVATQRGEALEARTRPGGGGTVLELHSASPRTGPGVVLCWLARPGGWGSVESGGCPGNHDPSHDCWYRERGVWMRLLGGSAQPCCCPGTVGTGESTGWGGSGFPHSRGKHPHAQPACLGVGLRRTSRIMVTQARQDCLNRAPPVSLGQPWGAG